MSTPLEQAREKVKAIFKMDYDKGLARYCKTWMKGLGHFATKDDLRSVLSETYLKIDEELEKTPDPTRIDNYQGWIRSLLYYQTLTYLKSIRKLNVRLDDLEQDRKLMMAITYSIEENFDFKTLLEKIMSELSEREKQLLVWVMEGFKSYEIAGKFNAMGQSGTADSVRQEKKRLIDFLRKKFGNQ